MPILQQRAPQSEERSVSLAVDAEPILQDLIRQLVRQLEGSRSGTERTSGAPDEVLLDLEVEGVRCYLIRTTPYPPPAVASLSPREQEIARMVARGYPNKTIAAVLDISAWTVGTYLRRIFAKTGVSSRAAMVAKLLEASPREKVPPAFTNELPRRNDFPLPLAAKSFSPEVPAGDLEDLCV